MSESLHRSAEDTDAVARSFGHPAFATLRRAGTPSVRLHGTDLRLGWANQAATRLFEVEGYEGLRGRITGRGNLAARALGDLMRSLRPDGAPRLVRLRFAWGARVHNFAALCGRGQDADGLPTLVLCFLGPEAESAGRGSAWEAEAQGHPAASGGGAGPAAEPLPRTDGPVPVEADHQPRLIATQGGRVDERRDLLRRALGGREGCRIAWRTDAAGALVEIDGSTVQALGIPLLPGPGETFADQAARFDPAGAARLAAALRQGATWSGIELLAPASDGTVAVPLVLAGAPQFDARRHPLGFRGFAKLDLARLQWRDRPEAGERPALSVPPDVVIEAQPLLFDAADALDAAAVPMPDGPIGPADPLSPSAPKRMPEPPVVAGPGVDMAAVRTDAPAGTLDRSANVVQLWPLHPPMLGRPAPSSTKSLSFDAGVEGPGSGREPAAEIAGADLQSTIEAAIARGLDRKGGLTSSEHQTFQEIGRVLGPGPRRAGPPSFAADARSPTPVIDGPGGPDPDLTRHAAAMVEHMAAGLLVVRERAVLFANEALRERLGFENHSELRDALMLHFARNLPPDGAEAMLPLPTAEGDRLGFRGSCRIIDWSGRPARLWTLLPETDATPSAPAGTPGDFESALDIAGDAIAIVDAEGRLLRLNREGERCFGRAGEILGQAFTSLLVPESRATSAALFDQATSNPDARMQVHGECAARSADGVLLPLDMRILRLDGRRLAILWRDLSARRALERELAQARRQAARAGDQNPDFLANVSLQIRTPLNAILGFAEIMTDERFGPLGNPRYKDYLKDIHTSGTQVIALIDDLMDLSRIEAGRLELRLGAVDINKIIVDCVGEAHVLAHRERVIVRTSFGARLPPVLADERSARQIIGNLLSNAIKFNEPGGQVIVSTGSADGASVVVRIRDTGIGMSDTDIAAALEPFRQLAPTKNTSGTGLGLPLTKALVGANGASLSMRSRPNEGTMVEVTFQATVPTPTRVPA